MFTLFYCNMVEKGHSSKRTEYLLACLHFPNAMELRQQKKWGDGWGNSKVSVKRKLK